MLCCTVMIVRWIEENTDHEKSCSRHEKQEKVCKVLVRLTLMIILREKEGSRFILFGFFLFSLLPNKTG